MPRVAKTRSALLKEWLKSKNKDHFKTDGSIVFCHPCQKQITAAKKDHLDSHIATSSHKKQVQSFSSQPKQTLLTPNEQKIFNQDLCQAFLAADIPVFKLNNPVLKSFLSKYTTKHIPGESTIRKGYLKQQYQLEIHKIRENIGNKNIWLGIDETTDSTGRYIVNVLVGAMRDDRLSKSYLIASKEVKSANHKEIANVVDDALRILWPDSMSKDKVLLLLTDSVAYMKKAGKLLKTFYSKMLHVTCLAHALHLVAEEIRSSFKCVDKLISNIKKVFSKAPKRLAIYKQMCSHLALPPKPVLTRWGTWLKAVDFYRQNYSEVKAVIQALDPTEAESVRKSQELFESASLCTDLAYLCSNFTFLADQITKLEESRLSLSESVAIVTESTERLESVEGEIGIKVAQKLSAVLVKKLRIR